VKLNRVRIQKVTGNGSVGCDLVGDDTITGGVGGWEQRSRARRTPKTVWNETPGLTWQVPVLFDGGDDGRSVEAVCRRLEAWGVPGNNDDTPPILTVDAPAGRQPAGLRWVLQDLAWGDQERNDDGERTQQYATLTFLQYVPGKVAKGPAGKSRDSGAGKKHKWVPISEKNRDCKVCKKPRSNAVHTNRGDG
jgi:hypothetical protein